MLLAVFGRTLNCAMAAVWMAGLLLAASTAAAQDEKSIVLVYLDGKAGEAVADTAGTDLKIKEAVSGTPKFKFDTSGGRKDLGQVSNVIFNIFDYKNETEVNPAGLYAIFNTSGMGSLDAGKEYDFGKLPDGWSAMNLRNPTERGGGIKPLKAGKYLMTLVVQAENATGTVRVFFEVK